jgi:acyl carrier protein
VDALEQRVLDVVARIFRVSRRAVTLQSSPDTIPNWDSLQQVHLILALEEEFGVQFEVDQIAVMGSVEPIVAMVRRLSEPGRAP